MVAIFLAKAEWHFDGFDDWNSSGILPLLILVGALLAILLFGATNSAHRSRTVRIPFSSDLFPNGDTPNDFGTPPTRRHQPHPFRKRDKRAWLRRDGSPLEIQVANSERSQPAVPALVLNRSRGGLLLSFPQPAAPGTLLSVRPPHAPDEQVWIQLEVRHCKQKQDRWHLGCKFTEELPWSVLLLFG